MDKRAAFLRAWEFLNFKRVAKWLALVASCACGLLYVALLLVFGLVVDLLAGRSGPADGLGFIGQPLGWLIQSNRWLGEWQVSQPAVGYLISLLAIGLALGLVWAALDWLLHYAAAVTTTEAALRMRRAVYHNSYRLGWLAFRAAGPAEALSLFTRHIEVIHDALAGCLTIALRDGVKLVLLLLVGFLINFWLGLVLVLAAVLAWLLGTQIGPLLQARTVRTTNQAAAQLALLQESLQLLRLVKCHIMEIFHQGRVEKQLALASGLQLQREAALAWQRTALVLAAVLGSTALLLVAGLILLNGEVGISGLVLLGAVLASLVPPVRNGRALWGQVQRGADSAAGLFKFLERQAEVSQAVGADVLPRLAQGIEFDNVSLREPGTNRPLLHGVSLAIPAGQRVALIGPDEQEKHALLYLIPD
jgi:ABC-type bacteriocin/lantibiotic exporter with double-glycine peptidase domain